ncbi:hypothetical protein L1987_58810 [Smallanthus sonchifolius]|uniref:Uncharacterized protein n=1 Tax=Smallanthus sonchifolius TaxID=185202 RepID=A0ACB9D3E6_9ASTR|nr:hypothetical protein L1987_58810 [Smallanthus sonchifolius]
MPKPHDQKIPSFVDRGQAERGRSFKDALTNQGGLSGKHRGENDGTGQKVVKVTDETMAFASLQTKSLVGRASSLKALMDLQLFINDIGGSEIGVKFLGGLSVLLSFPNQEGEAVREEDGLEDGEFCASKEVSGNQSTGVEEDGCLPAVSECRPQCKMSGFGGGSDFVRPKKRQRKELEDDPFDLNILLGLGPAEKEVGCCEQQVEVGSEDAGGGSEGISPVLSFDLNKGVTSDIPGKGEDGTFGVEPVDGRAVLSTDAAAFPSALDKEVEATVEVGQLLGVSLNNFRLLVQDSIREEGNNVFQV